MFLSFHGCERKYPSVMEFLTHELPRAGTPWRGIRLDLSSTRLSNEQLAEVMQRLKHFPVRELDLSSNGINDEGSSIVAVALQTNKQLVKIHLNHNTIGDKGTIDLAQILRPDLDVDLRHNQIGQNGAEAWTHACIKNNKTVVDLTHNLLGDHGAFHVAFQVSRNAGRIQRLVLTHNNIGHVGDKELAVLVPRNIQIFHRIRQVPFADQYPGKALALTLLSCGLAIFVMPYLTAEGVVEGCDYHQDGAGKKA